MVSAEKSSLCMLLHLTQMLHNTQAQLLSDAAGVETVTLHFHKGSVFTSGSELGLQFLQDHAVVKLSFTSYFYESMFSKNNLWLHSCHYHCLYLLCALLVIDFCFRISRGRTA